MNKNQINTSSQEYTLQVSEFAALCNTTRDTLRYYYEQDILVPWKNPKNGYHYYSAAQISSFFFITTMRQLKNRWNTNSSTMFDRGDRQDNP